MAPPPSDDDSALQLDASAVFAALAREDEEQGWAGHGRVFPMVMSLGYNPFYKNTVRSVEVHILHDFARDFYGARLSLAILGFIRPEYDYVSKESLIEDIRTDIQVAARSLARPGYVRYRQDRELVEFDDVEDEEAGGEKGEVVS